MGYKRGWPDLFFPEPRGGFHGLFIELKIKGGKVSPEQIEVNGLLNDRGYHATVCYGFEEAQQTISFYMNMPGPR